MSGGGGTPAGPLVVGPVTSVSSGAYQALSTDSLIRVTGGAAVTITLGSVSIAPPAPGSGIQQGQRLTIVSFDSGGDTIAIVPTSGDNIDGGTQWNLGEYGAFVELEARNAAGVTNWIVIGQSCFEGFTFPIQPALAAGAQGPLNLGTLFIPEGPRYLHSVWAGAPTAITAGTITITITGPSGGPRTITLTSATQTTGTLFAPGNANEVTVPTQAGALFTASLSTNAAFTPAMACPAVLVKLWD
jgi:hypothetical protein